MGRLAADIGGTFTDVVYCDDAGNIRIVKSLTTPRDQSEGLGEAIGRIGARRDEVSRFLNGTTVVLNAILAGPWPRVGLLTTCGFRDVLEIMRGDAQEPYNLKTPKPEPLVPRRLRLEVTERVAADGSVLQPLVEAEVLAQATELLAAGAQAIAICFLNAYANPAHERAARDRIQTRFAGLPVSISSDVAPEWREFERTATVVLNTGALPVVDRYLERLAERLRAVGMAVPTAIMQSNGGVTSLAHTRRAPIRTVMSGPVGGVVAAERLGRELGIEHLLTLDIGGTSADVGLIRAGELLMSYETRVRGWPILTTSVDVHSVGAGGGSISYVDEMGAFKVGPQSAGSDPGPACLGRGGTEPTVTDAHLIVGHLDPAYFLGGEIRIDPAQAEAAFGHRVAQPLGIPVATAALGALDIINTVMARAIRDHSIRRGLDPREFALVAFGGCGGLHAAHLARSIGIKRVVIPPIPAAFSALGILHSDMRWDFTRTHLSALSAESDAALESAFRSLETEARAELAADGVELREALLQRSADLRYAGQQYTVTVAAGAPATAQALVESFLREHRRLYGHAMEGNPVEVTSLRLTVVSSAGARPRFARLPSGATPAPKSHRRILHRSEPTAAAQWLTVPVYQRESLPAGADLAGPTVVEEASSTTLVLPGDRLAVDATGSLLITIGG